ncbi:MAG: DUF6599 family protein [Chloroflexota bacterium]
MKWVFIGLSLTLASWFMVSQNGCCAEGQAVTDAIKWPQEGVQGWKWDGIQAFYDRDTLYQYIDGAAEVYLAYNFQHAEARRYLKEGRPSIVAELYQMKSSQDAFGLFSLERQDPEAGIGQGSELGGGMLRFWKGRYFASLFAEGEGRDLDEALLLLGRMLAASIGDTGEPPRLLRFLAELPQGQTPERVCFVRSHIVLNRCYFISHQNILNLGPEVEALIVRLPGAGSTARMFLGRYPSEPLARSAFLSFRSAYMPDSRDRALVRTEDGRWTKAECHREFVVIVFGASERAEAERLVASTVAKLREEVR